MTPLVKGGTRFDQEVFRMLSELKDHPGQALKKTRRLASILRARIQFRECQLGNGVAAEGRVRLEHPERMVFGNRVTFLAGMIPTELACGPQGGLFIGDDVVLNYGVSLRAEHEVRIGHRSMLASYVRVADRSREKVAPIIIGDDVWIAHGAIIEAGVTIGNGSVVSAGSVVIKDIPPQQLAIGNPARAMSLDLLG
jgi:acetyltransferase-like isoleucine patch superfamily enzyme